MPEQKKKKISSVDNQGNSPKGDPLQRNQNNQVPPKKNFPRLFLLSLCISGEDIPIVEKNWIAFSISAAMFL